MGKSVIAKKNSDYKYSNDLVSRFINILMLNGKKSKSVDIVYGAIDWLSEHVEGDSLENFTKAVSNVRPELEVKSRRVGGSTYQIPVEIADERREALAIRWLVRFARKRNGKSMVEKLGRELVDAINSTGAAYKKMEETHRMADANKAFSHYKL